MAIPLLSQKTPFHLGKKVVSSQAPRLNIEISNSWIFSHVGKKSAIDIYSRGSLFFNFCFWFGTSTKGGETLELVLTNVWLVKLCELWSSWWFFEKICSSKWVHLPQVSGWKFQIYLKPPPSGEWKPFPSCFGSSDFVEKQTKDTSSRKHIKSLIPIFLVTILFQ